MKEKIFVGCEMKKNFCIGKNFIITFFSILLLLSLITSLTEISNFNGYSSPENITFTGNENYTRNITINRYSYFVNAVLNLSGYASSDYPFESNVSNISLSEIGDLDNVSGYGFENAGDGNWSTFTAPEIYGMAGICGTESDGVYQNYSTILNGRNATSAILYFEVGGGCNTKLYIWNTTDFEYIDSYSYGAGFQNHTYEIPKRFLNESVLQLKFMTLKGGGSRNHFYESNLSLTIYEEYPNNSFIILNNTQIWNYSGQFNETFSPNQTDNFTSTLNTALNFGACNCSGCSLSGDNCTINFTFHSDSIGFLEYSTINLSYNLLSEMNLAEVATSCTAGLSEAMHFNFSDEQNLSQITSATISYNFKFGITNSTQELSSGILSNISEFYLCINTTLNNNFSLGYGEVQYSATDYSDRRYYTFTSQTLTNETINTTLYLLSSASSTSFLVEIKDPALNPYTESYTTLLRWYPDQDEYKVVEMGKTDDKGQTIKKVQIEDADYRIGVYYPDGTLIYLANPIRLVCLESPCSYNLKVPSSSSEAYANFLGVQSSLDYESGVFSLTYNDPSQTTSLMELDIYLVTGTSETLICTDNSTSFTGVLTCNVSSYKGLLKAVAFRSASPARALAVKWIDTTQTIFQGTFGLFITFIMFVTLFLLGIASPIIAIILGIVALVPALVIKSLTYPMVVGIAILGGIVIHFIRQSK